jgi:D-xylose transport system permease protein
MNQKMNVRSLSMLLVLVATFTVFALTSPVFLSPRNLSLLMVELSVTAILALGMLLVILPGQIDLSAGSGVGLLGAIAAVLVTNQGLPAGVALLLAAGVGALVWTLMGSLIVIQKIPSFIITLGGLLVFKGLHWLVIKNQTVPIVPGGQTNLYSLLTTYYLPSWAGYGLAALSAAGLAYSGVKARKRRQEFGFETEDGELTFLRLFVFGQLLLLLPVLTGAYRGVPLAAVLLGVVALIVYVVTQHTPFGRYLYAIGGNEEAARISGVPLQRVVITAYTLMGLIVSLSGFMQTAYGGASTATVGSLMELDAVAACVIGGTSLKGGRGTVVGVLFGALMMATLLNGLTLLAVSPEVKFIARGVVLAAAVWMDVKLTGPAGR